MSRLSTTRGQIGLLVALFAGLLLVLLAVPAGQEQLPPLTVYSAAPTGGKALRLWLGALGYSARSLETRPYRVPRGTATLLVLAPTFPLGAPELDELEHWTSAGGTLILATEGLFGAPALERFGFGLRALPVATNAARSLSSNLLDPLTGEVIVGASEELLLLAEGAEPLLGDGQHVYVAVAPLGTGRVVALSAPGLFSNAALRNDGNARFALSLVGPPGAGMIVFDEVHHGYGAAEQRSLWSLLLERAWGRAALYAGLLAFLFLMLRGRRFGRAQALVASRGRSLAEYVTSLAGLYRAGGKQAFVAEHFRHRLRRDLANALGLPADTSDQEIRAGAQRIGHDSTRALEAIAALGLSVGERQLLRLVREAETEVVAVQRPALPETAPV